MVMISIASCRVVSRRVASRLIQIWFPTEQNFLVGAIVQEIPVELRNQQFSFFSSYFNIANYVTEIQYVRGVVEI